MATTEPTAPLPATAPAPAEGTPIAATPVPAEATPPSPAPTDWEARYKAAQAELTRQQMARAAAERERDALKLERPPEDPDDAPARPARRDSEAAVEWRRRAELAEWQIAESVHGPDVMAAYRKSAELLASATTPADVVNAYRVFHQELSVAETRVPAPAPAPVPAPAPSVDSNRSDGPLPEVEQQLREAAAAKDLTGWIKAALRRGPPAG